MSQIECHYLIISKLWARMRDRFPRIVASSVEAIVYGWKIDYILAARAAK